MSASLQHIDTLSSGTYTACDISDALLKLGVPHAGFLVDIENKLSPSTRTTPLVAPATTVLFAPKPSPTPTSTLPPGTHFADLITAPNTIAVLSAPPGTRCAVIGGLVAKRMQKRGVCGVVVAGRVRDLKEMRMREWEVWAEGVSTVGAGAETRVVAVDCEVEVSGVRVRMGDVVFADREGGGVVVIPAERVEEVVGMLEMGKEVDALVEGDLEAGMELGEAFRIRRG
ncbi:RraA-like protein [Wilcoxina mikolae CBS 423.85]|nr:RraA-like protein [Wilcoxina mikolae CBS 423.85]